MKKRSKSILKTLRDDYHRNLCTHILGYRISHRTYSNADKDSPASKEIAEGMAARMPFPKCPSPPSPQNAGSLFANYTLEYLQASFGHLSSLRPGTWFFSKKQKRRARFKPPVPYSELKKRKLKTKELGALGIADFDQYLHLQDLEAAAIKYEEIRSLLGTEYIISPDIIIARCAVTDSEVNAFSQLVGSDDEIAKATPLRASNNSEDRFILHASISCKWSIRSDRSQNTRTEALNLMRNRKGRTPHIISVTAEPLPGRLASIALGMGDIDCTYHAALYELIESTNSSVFEEEKELLRIMVEGRRLRDISDLPFDLAI